MKTDELSEARPNCKEDGELDDELTFGNGETRRHFLAGVAGGGAAVAFTPAFLQAAPLGGVVEPVASVPRGGIDLTEVNLKINGKDTTLKIDPRVTLLDALRNHLGMTGTKKGCDHGQCGACTVIVNGRRINSCLSLALVHEGDEVTTVEGLAKGDELHPVQAAFIEHDGFQCGYCTPGQICSAVALIQERHANSDDEIREWMSGNICRCGAYTNILAAIREATTKMGGTAV